MLRVDDEVRLLSGTPGSIFTAKVAQVGEQFVWLRYFENIYRVRQSKLMWLGQWAVLSARDLVDTTEE